MGVALQASREERVSPVKIAVSETTPPSIGRAARGEPQAVGGGAPAAPAAWREQPVLEDERPCGNTQANQGEPMPQVIVSYDGTRNDRDALALRTGCCMLVARISLAYVRHATEPDAQHEAAAQGDAEHLLAIGADPLGGDERGAARDRIPTAEGLAPPAAGRAPMRSRAGRAIAPRPAEWRCHRRLSSPWTAESRAPSRSLPQACGESRSSEASGPSASLTRATTLPRWRAQRPRPCAWCRRARAAADVLPISARSEATEHTGAALSGRARENGEQGGGEAAIVTCPASAGRGAAHVIRLTPSIIGVANEHHRARSRPPDLGQPW